MSFVQELRGLCKRFQRISLSTGPDGSNDFQETAAFGAKLLKQVADAGIAMPVNLVRNADSGHTAQFDWPALEDGTCEATSAWSETWYILTAAINRDYPSAPKCPALSSDDRSDVRAAAEQSAALAGWVVVCRPAMGATSLRDR